MKVGDETRKRRRDAADASRGVRRHQNGRTDMWGRQIVAALILVVGTRANFNLFLGQEEVLKLLGEKLNVFVISKIMFYYSIPVLQYTNSVKEYC